MRHVLEDSRQASVRLIVSIHQTLRDATPVITSAHHQIKDTMNHNVLLCFLFRVFDGLATGIWASSVLSNFISVSLGGGDGANEVRHAHQLFGSCSVT